MALIDPKTRRTVHSDSLHSAIQIKVIAEDKMVDLNAFTVESAMKMVAGTARSMGITVKGGQKP